MGELQPPISLSSHSGSLSRECRQQMLCRWVAARWRRDVACRYRIAGRDHEPQRASSHRNRRMHLPEQQCLLSLYNAASNEIARLVYERFAGCFDGNNCKRGYGRALTMIASITSAIFDDVAESKLQPLNCPSILHSPPQYNRIICSRFSCVPSEPKKSDLCHICPLSIPSRCATSCHFPSFVSSAEREDHPFSGFKCLY